MTLQKYIDDLGALIENAPLISKNDIINELKSLQDEMINDDNLVVGNLTSYDDELNFYKKNLMHIINSQKVEVETNLHRDRPIKLDLKHYSEMIITKLHILFNSFLNISQDEAEENCANYIYLQQRYEVFIQLIDWINDNGVSLLVDRLIFCSFLHISLEAYELFLKSSNEKVRSIFLSIENMYLSQKTNASEIGTRNPSAIRTNLSYDKVGSGLTPKDNDALDLRNIKKVLDTRAILQKAKSLGYSENDVIDIDATEKN